MRTRGTGSLVKKKNSPYWYTLIYDATGRQICQSTKTTSKQVAEGILRNLLGQVDRGVPVEKMRKLRYEEIRACLLADYRVKKNRSLEQLENGEDWTWGLDSLDPFFRNMLVKGIDTDVLYRFIEHRQEEGVVDSTINRNLALLRRMFNLAKQQGKIQSVPYFPMLAEENVREGFVEHEDFEKLLAALPEKLRPLVRFLYETGCRVGAARKILWSQVEFWDGRAFVRLEGKQTKNKKPLMLALTMEVSALLRKQFRRSEGSVFCATNLRRAWEAGCIKAGLAKRVCSKCGVDLPKGRCKECGKAWRCYVGLTIHDLRRSGARNLVRAGVPETVVMKIGGWKTRAVFIRYNITTTEDIEEAMDKLSNATTMRPVKKEATDDEG